jgi:superfamily I DNA/RNA helicase
MVTAIEPAVGLYEEPPTDGMVVDTPWGEVWLGADDWAESFGSLAPGTPHNEGRDEVWNELLTILVDKHRADRSGTAVDDGDEDVPEAMLRRALAHHSELVDAFDRAWPVIDYCDLVGDLWSVPAYLRRCAPWLERDEVRALQRADPHAWTVSDLPLLDAARQRLGDPAAARRNARQRARLAAEQDEMSRVIDHLVAADDSEMQVMSMLRSQDMQYVLVDEAVQTETDPDRLAGPFAHIVVDEAQELTDAEWQMLLLRCPSRSLTVVGDRAQARRGFPESWRERLSRIGLARVELASLSVNYRTPAEVMAEAEPVIRTVLPDANVPTSVRTTGLPVEHGRLWELGAILDAWRDEHADGIACVVSADAADRDSGACASRVRWLSPQLAKGLEFDLVVLIDPDTFGDGVAGAVDRYVAMSRTTQRLVILTG